MGPNELRLKAAEIIEQRGWAQGWDQRGRGVCPLAALKLAAGIAADSTRMLPGEVETAISDMGFDVHMSIKTDKSNRLHIWNDAPERTQAEVIARLRAGLVPVAPAPERT